MSLKPTSKLSRKKKYLQVALNSSLEDARNIINKLPISDRIIIEAGTPFIKRYGASGISQIYNWWNQRIGGYKINISVPTSNDGVLLRLIKYLAENKEFEYDYDTDDEDDEDYVDKEENAPSAITASQKTEKILPYIVADLKTMDRAETEVVMAAEAGASAAIALGHAPIETLNSFVETCQNHGVDSMIDMMNVEYPLSILSALKKPPTVVILHRGVDEEQFNKEKQIPLHEIRRIKGRFDIMISIAGGDTPREVQRSVFNDADIVVIWKSVFKSENTTIELIENFLKEIK